MLNPSEDNILQSCCNIPSDKRLLNFIASLLISLIIVIFSCYQLANINDGPIQSLYVGLITLIIGIWCPNPIHK